MENAKTHPKNLEISSENDKKLKIISAITGKSQKYHMLKAIEQYIDRVYLKTIKEAEKK